MTAKACYPDPLASISTCSLVCATTAGPCTAPTTARRDVSDGMSNTLIVGERGIPQDLREGWLLCGAGVPVGTGNLDAHLSVELGLRPGKDDGAHNTHFWSHHAGGAHFLLGDGSVRFLSENLSQQTLRRLATRAAGDVPGEF